ncbi:MAG: hypothetical protein OEX22_12635 [Cyclobacteriaceae bacterium]|nr:hypothetical protein [Cyclobacteriaceae bacterium]
MSSHHVIREQQEPALLISDVKNTYLEDIQPLLEWSPTILVLQNCIDTVMKWGIKIDGVVVREHDLSETKQKLIRQEPIKYITHTKEQENLTTAIHFLVQHKHEAVNIIGDEFLLFPIVNPFTNSLQLVVHNKYKRSYRVTHHFRKWVLANTQFEILPETKTIKTAGLQKVNNLYVSSKEGKIEIRDLSSFWVIEHL